MLPPILLGIVLFAIVIFLYSLISNRLEGTVITAPMVFVATGLLLSPDGFDIIAVSANSGLILIIAEIALVLVLFSDAARIDLRALKGNGQLPSRLLLIGLPLTIFAGSLVAIAIFTGIEIPEAALIGAILAPTDAGLGQAIVNSPKIPVRIRQALNVESGLNDGGAIPFFAFFLILATTEAINSPVATGVVIAVEQIGLGILVGAAVGLVGGYLVNAAIRRGYMTGRFTWIGFLALALISFIGADAVGGSGFIAAFIGGMVTAATGKHVGEAVIEFTETGGQILSLGVFFIFGIVFATTLAGITVAVIFYAILSLTVIRMVPVAISLIGTRLQRTSVGFIGWFGPRGLASIVLLLIVLDEAPELPGLGTIGVVVATTILISVFAHGISAAPLIDRYARKVAVLSPEAPERREVVELPTRMRTLYRDSRKEK
jgi:NhaP-type Na+/H+ or K+/H+ antiporter